MKRNYIALFVVICTLLCILACGMTFIDYVLYKPGDFSEQTQLETREIQSRVYDVGDNEKVYNAVISTLQDDGYMIKNLEKDTGYVNAVKESIRSVLWRPTNTEVPFKDVFEATINITNYGAKTKVRINFYYRCFRMPYKNVTEYMSNTLEITSTDVYDAKLFQDFYSKLDKALFLEGQKL